MAALELIRREEYPDILIAVQADIFTSPDSNGDVKSYRTVLKEALAGLREQDSPVRPGTHDFWITYPIPAEGSSVWSGEDMGTSPRPLRGIVKMTTQLGSQEAIVRENLHTLLQEVGHHWLVRSFAVKGQRALPAEEEVQLALAEGRPLPEGPLLLGRGDSHWASYLSADGSPLDGVHYSDAGVEHGRDRWLGATYPGPEIAPRNLAPIKLEQRYSSLDRLLMGRLRGAERLGGCFRWIRPQLTAPLDFQAGLFVDFGSGKFAHFGFFRDHRRLALVRTGATQNLDSTPTTELRYDPFAGPEGQFPQLAIRQQGDELSFGYRLFQPPRQAPLATRPGPPSDTSGLFHEVGRLRGERPLRMGLIARRWKARSFHLEAAFCWPELWHAGEHVVLSTDPLPPVLRSGTLADPHRHDPPHFGSIIPVESFLLHVPQPGPLLRNRYYAENGPSWFEIAMPPSRKVGEKLEGFEPPSLFDHGKELDGAPKLVTRAPEGDFEFSAFARIHRALLGPNAGGTTIGKTVWGRAHCARLQDVEISEPLRKKQEAPPENKYRFAFILVAANKDEVTDEMVANLDNIRRYWDEAFAECVGDRMVSDSSLE